jgi:hypothetical protein
MRIRFCLLLATATGSFAALVPSSKEKPLQITSADTDASARNKAYVRIQNKLPVKVSFELDHLRGLDYYGTNETKAWHNVNPGKYADKWEISYEKGKLITEPITCSC